MRISKCAVLRCFSVIVLGTAIVVLKGYFQDKELYNVVRHGLFNTTESSPRRLSHILVDQHDAINGSNNLHIKDIAYNNTPLNETIAAAAVVATVPITLQDELEATKERVHGVCSRFPDIKHDQATLEQITGSTTIYVDDKYKFLYCPIHKVATANWRRVLMVLAGDVKNESLVGTSHYFAYTSKHRPLRKYTPKERIHRLNTYKKFMFVRHPYERLLSAFRDKFEMGVKHAEWWYMETFGIPIKKWAHPAMSGRELSAQKTKVTFDEFIGYVTAFANTKRIDMHWEQYHKLCRPCEIEYDIIGKYETIERDSNYVLEQVNAAQKIHFPSMRLNDHNTHTSVNSLENYLAKLSDTQLKNLKQTYELDFDLFGYQMT